MLEIAICDDNPLHSYYTQIVLKHSIDVDYNITVYNNAYEFMDIIRRDSLYFDIALLDIDLGKVSGIEIAKTIKYVNPLCQIIFITGYINYALEVYDIDHTYFILKNEIEKRLPSAIQKAMGNLKRRHDESLIIKQKARIIAVTVNDILYLERIKRLTSIVCVDEEITVYEKLSELYERLNQNYFIYCHNSYIVNLNKVKEFTRNEFILCDGNSIPISRNYYNNVKTEFLKFAGNQL